VFALLYASVELIFLRAPQLSAPTDEIIAWYSDSGNRATLLLAFNLAAFSAIAFLWFVAVLRRRVGEREDKFFGTVFLGSGLLFVALYLVGLGIRISVVVGLGVEDRVPDPADVILIGGASRLILLVAMPRMQAMFVASTSTIGRTTGALPPWLTAAGYLFALVLALVPVALEVPGLGFGLWVALVSGSLLVHRHQIE